MLVGAVLAALVLRGWRLGEIGISHYDEGVYAIAAQAWPWSADYPLSFVAYFAPPGYPLLARLAGMLLPTELALLAVSVAGGTATVVAGWWLGRLAWDGRTGLLAAWLLALDGVQVAYARTALVDATLTPLFVVGLGLLVSAMRAGDGVGDARRPDPTGDGKRRGRSGDGTALAVPRRRRGGPMPPATAGRFPYRRAIAAGVCVGGGWLVKYSGFVPLLIGLGWTLAAPRQRRALACWTLAAAVAGACYALWAVPLHQAVGYGSLVAHQRGYTLGPTAVPANLLWLTTALPHFALAWAGVPLALAAWLTPLSRWLAAVLGLFAVALWATGLQPILLAALALYGWLATSQDRPAKWWTIAVVLLLPAIYTPYLRIWLPSLTLLTVAAAAGWLRLLALPTLTRNPKLQYGFGPVFLLLAFSPYLWPAGDLRWLPETPAGYRTAAAVLNDLRDDRPALALVRPALLVSLATPVRRLGDGPLPAAPSGTLLIVDASSADAPQLAAAIAAAEAAGRLEVVASLPVDASRIARLNQAGPNGLADPEHLTAYRFR